MFYIVIHYPYFIFVISYISALFLISVKLLYPYSTFFFFFNDTAPTEIYPLPLHDALPIPRGFGRILQLLHRVHAPAVDAQNDVARLDFRSLGGARDLLDHQTPLRVRLLLLLRRERPHGQSQRARPIAAMARGLARSRGELWLLLQFRDPDVDALLLAVAPHRQGGIRARPHRGYGPGELAVALDRVPADTEDDIPRGDSRVGRRAVLLHRGHQCAVRPLESEGLGELRVDVLDGHADAAADHAAGLDELLLDVARHVDRNGERDAHEAAGAAEDLRVDADHLACHVEQRSARVAGIHRYVGLDERHVVLARHRARGGADDARGGAVLEAEGRADREHPLPRLDARGIAELHDGQVGGADLDYRHVGALVGADDLGGELAPVGEAHRHLIRVGHHVRVGEDVAVGVDDESGARAARRRLVGARPLLGAGNAEAAEEIIERIVGRQSRRAPGRGLRLLHDLHVHDRRPVAVHQLREVRQPPQHGLRCRGGRGARGLRGGGPPPPGPRRAPRLGAPALRTARVGDARRAHRGPRPPGAG